jgi:predicted TIM-barrel fold metal-dependent hydrolase
MSVIDIHQHTNYSGRSNEELIAHQRAMGVDNTVLLPAGSLYGLAVGAGGNDTCVELAKQHPDQFLYFANEVSDLPQARRVLEKYLQIGAIGIGEQKFAVEADSGYIDQVAALAHYYGVPVLLHFEYGTYNLGFERFHKVLERFPQVDFIGHAQTWWLNIDKNADPRVLSPKGPVTPGGLTDRWLSDYHNLYGDLSAGSGLNALQRDEDHARAFLARHQDKLLYGSDCSDRIGSGPKCSGSQQLATVRRLSPNPQATEKMLYGNAARLFRIPLPRIQ